MNMTHQWRFGYGSNIGLTTLREKKNLTPSRYLVGTINGWELYFNQGLNEFVEPGFAAIRPAATTQNNNNNGDDGVAELHGSAFLIPNEEVDGLDRQERGYNVMYVQFTSYDGEVIENLGLYVPKTPYIDGVSIEGVPSYRYLKLIQDGAREGNLAPHWMARLDQMRYYVTPPEVRAKTLQWISDFHDADDTNGKKKDLLWSAEKLAKHDGSNDNFPAHTSIMGYILQINPDMKRVFSSWKGHNITRRNLLQFNGKSLDTNDIRYNEPGYRPLPRLCDCTDGEREYLMQSLDAQLHKGSRIVARYEPFLADQ